uniref:Putative secreted protein n=1 Tax=Anopheles darlingi TaxID=43151 RepID=A0A2M4D9M0_ANODA
MAATVAVAAAAPPSSSKPSHSFPSFSTPSLTRSNRKAQDEVVVETHPTEQQQQKSLTNVSNRICKKHLKCPLLQI